MTARDPFEARLGRALHRYADAAPVDVDPYAVVRYVTAGRRPGIRLSWLVLAALLVTLAVAMALIVGSQRRTAPPEELGGTGLLAFSVDDDVYLANADGTAVRQLTTTDEHEIQPTWSPDGARLAFWTLESSSGPASLWVAQATGGEPRVVAPDVIVADVNGVEHRLSWSPDGREIVFLVFAAGEARDDSVLTVANVETGTVRTIPGPALQRRAPAWSPDGHLIAFVGRTNYRPGAEPLYEDSRLYVVGADGTGEDAITDPAEDVDPFDLSWSPDGRSIAYSRAVSGVAYEHLAVARLTGDAWSSTALVAGDTSTEGHSEYTPTWSHDGTRVAFLLHGFEARAPDPQDGTLSAAELWLVNADGSGARRLLPDLVTGARPCWSPDDRAITTVAADGTIRVIPVDGSTPTVHRWAPVGKVRGCSWQALPTP